MKTLVEFIQDENYKKLVTEAFVINESVEIINESFKSPLLTKLAAKIKSFEKKNNDRAKERAERYKKDGYTSPSYINPNIVSFGSILGPKQDNRGNTLQGIKWNEITDDDFEVFSGEDSKELKKAIQNIYRGKQADVILTNDGDPIAFIKGYVDKNDNPKWYYFVPESAWNHGVKVRKETKYKYGERDLKWNEAYDLLTANPDYKIYILNITDDMIKTYKDLFDMRKDQKKGVINYDETSLKQLAKEQKAHYDVLVKKLKSEKLKANSSSLLEEIQKIQAEVMEVYNKCLSADDMLDYYAMGSLMDYVNYAYQQLYQSKYNDKRNAELKRKYPNSGDSYYKNQSDSSIRDAKKYLDRVRQGLDEIKANLK